MMPHECNLFLDQHGPSVTVLAGFISHRRLIVSDHFLVQGDRQKVGRIEIRISSSKLLSQVVYAYPDGVYILPSTISCRYLPGHLPEVDMPTPGCDNLTSTQYVIKH